MKYWIPALLTAIATASPALAEYDNLKIEQAETEQPTEQKLLRVCTLNSPEAFQNFQTNVNRIQSQRQRVIELNTAIERAQTEKLKESLQAELEEAMATLTELNKQMFETYRFSLTRDYTVVVEKASVYMFVTEEEAAAFENAQTGDGPDEADKAQPGE